MKNIPKKIKAAAARNMQAKNTENVKALAFYEKYCNFRPMSKARIYQPAKNAMQSGKGKTQNWLLEYIPETPYFIEGLMGWSGMDDTKREISLRFPSKEAAISYAKDKKIEFELLLPNTGKQRSKSYADNFIFSKVIR